MLEKDIARVLAILAAGGGIFEEGGPPVGDPDWAGGGVELTRGVLLCETFARDGQNSSGNLPGRCRAWRVPANVANSLRWSGHLGTDVQPPRGERGGRPLF